MYLLHSCCSGKKLQLPTEKEEVMQEKQAVSEEGNS